ncbi:hypothetical protein CE161_03880 [Bifidobacterium longum]|nr:hypothetical protein CE161_03880 [Bifidobacterium longum]
MSIDQTSSIARNLNDKTIFRSRLMLSEKLVSYPLTSRVAQSIPAALLLLLGPARHRGHLHAVSVCVRH